MEDPKQTAISELRLDELILKVLADICEFLDLPHVVQEFLSAQLTPTLSMVLPAYENLILALEQLRREKRLIRHAISATLAWLRKYFAKARGSRIYALAMSKFQRCT